MRYRSEILVEKRSFRTMVKGAIISFVFSLLVLDLLLSTTVVLAQPAGDKLILISLDGLQLNHFNDMLGAGRLPNFTLLVGDAGFNGRAEITRHSYTATGPGHAEMLSGFGDSVTGVSDNSGDALPDGLSVFEKINSARADIVLGSVCGKDSSYFPDELLVNAIGEIDWWQNFPNWDQVQWEDKPNYATAASVANKATEFIGRYSDRPFFLFVHFEDSDAAGHKYEANSSNYDQAVLDMDKALGILLGALQAQGIANDTDIIITSDHGFAEDGTSHNDGSDLNNRRIVLISNNRSLVSDTTSNGVREQSEITPTILDYFGIDITDLENYGSESMISSEPAIDRVLSLSSTSGGSVTNPGEGSLTYGDQVVVSIVATAFSNYQFVNWTGTAVDAGQVANLNFASTTVTVNASYTLRANFSIGQHDLKISSSSGGSVVTPGEGTYPYDHGVSATVKASPASGYHFVNWTGSAVNAGRVANANLATTTVTMDAAYAVQANFGADQFTLAVTSTSGGSVNNPGEGSFEYTGSTRVSIQAIADGNYFFVNWTGTAVDAGKVTFPNVASTSVSVDAAYTLVANFGQKDADAPTISGMAPASGSIQARLNSLIILHVTDAGIGVNARSVEIKLDGATIYTGDTASYESVSGTCRRIGTPANYTYAYQASEMFDFDQLITVTVNAADIGGVVMDERLYSFTTEMRSFGQNKKVSVGLDNVSNAAATTVRDSGGNIWAVWHVGPAGRRDIYLGKLAAGANAFGASVRLTTNASDQVNPALALGDKDRLYVVWQDNRRGNWDIYGLTSANGTNWSAAQRIADADDKENFNQFNPAIVVDSDTPNNNAHVVWQDDRAGNQDIFAAKSSDSFVTNSITQVTSNNADQTDPAIAATSSGAVYVLWTDARNLMTGTDIYGARGGSWDNVPVVTKATDQSNPVIATESSGSALHMLWIDQGSGNGDIYYASSNGLPSSPLAGSNLIEDGSNAAQVSPTIAVAGTGGGLNVFACWQDARNVSGNTGDLDLYMVQADSGSGTNVFVGDGGTNSDQTEPAMAIDQDGYPYLVWTDSRAANAGIYYVGSTFVESTPLVAGLVEASSGGTIGAVNVQSITDVDDVSISLPAGASRYDMIISITKVGNPHEFALPILNGYEFSPSGLEFALPVTITIPYVVTGAAGVPTAYWFDPRTATLSQEGISNIQIIEVTPSLHALRFTTTHLTQYYALLGAIPDAPPVGDGGGGGGGGCRLTPHGQGSAMEYLLPYILLLGVWAILKSKKTASDLRKPTKGERDSIGH